jgi:hypothetical protein
LREVDVTRFAPSAAPGEIFGILEEPNTMRRHLLDPASTLTFVLAVTSSLALTNCSDDAAQAAAPRAASAAAGGGTGGSGAGTSGSSAGGASMASSGSGGTESTPSPMPLVSRDAPAFASSSLSYQVTPDKANDDSPTTAWVPESLPGWIAYDLSGVPVDQRQRVLVAWYDGATQDYINEPLAESQQLPVDYTVEINAAPGGGEPPVDGWVEAANVTDNNRNSREHLIDLDGARWVRMRVTKGTATQTPLNLDVHYAPDGPSDAWLFLGDSITAMTFRYPISDLPARVHALDEERWPAVIPAGVGGTNTTSALAGIDEMLANYPGRYVVLGYGTNDHAAEFVMEDLVNRVFDAGKIPAIPRQPWTSVESVHADGVLNNQAIDALYEKYPAIFRGPDLWARLENRTDLIGDDIHPNEAGMVEIRAAWAEAMTAR